MHDTCTIIINKIKSNEEERQLDECSIVCTYRERHMLKNCRSRMSELRQFFCVLVN